MMIDTLSSISPLDGRYQYRTKYLSRYFSESALFTYRLKIEILYLIELSNNGIIRKLTNEEINLLEKISKLSLSDCHKIKVIENKTHHDIKAIEYYLRDIIEKKSLKDISSYIHFGITSDDINNIAYRMMITEGCKKIIFPELINTLKNLNILADKYKSLPMLGRTHGQPAIPTTVGKELAVFLLRLKKQFTKFLDFKLSAKFNGAIGSYNALVFTYPEIDWINFSKKFIHSLGLNFIPLSTQVNPNDDIPEFFSIFQRINNILIDLNQDIWRYISDNWFIQKNKEKYVGSSTMPQKINPIEFENSEGNLQMANGIFDVLNRELVISRLQRDLSDSTLFRNVGSALAYSLIAYQSLNKGLENIKVNKQKIKNDLNLNWNILTEALQTVARKKGDPLAYEKASQIGKNMIIQKKDWEKISGNLDKNLLNLSLENYIGLSKKLTQNIVSQINKLLNNISSIY